LNHSKWLWLAVAALTGIVIVMLPAPAGLSRTAQLILSLTAFTVVLWSLQVLNNGVASVLMMALMVLAGVKPPMVFSGFASPGLWILVCVLFYGFAMQRTGLAQRLAYHILALFPGTYAGILCAFGVMGLTLALGIPSMTVRTAIMVPIAWALVQSTGLRAHSRGAALILLTAFEMAVIPGCAFLYGSLMGPILETAFRIKHLPLSWLGYARVVTFPTLLLCLLLIGVNQWVLKPESPLQVGHAFARTKLAELGRFQRSEWITALVVGLSIVFWATDSLHHLPSFLPGMLGLAVLALTGVVRDQDIGAGVSWTLILFMGGIFSLANVLPEYKITEWLAGYLVPAASRLAFSPLALVLALALATFAMRFLDPSSLLALPLLFLPISDLTSAAGIPPLVVAAPLIVASVPFWLSYQNIWVAMTEGITGGEAFTSRQRILMANTYAAGALAALAVAVVFWRLTAVL
jgi:sodium-dependent dicarboxylate transporter 2/3/5